MNKTLLKLKLIQIQALNKGRIRIIPSIQKDAYILDTNNYFDDVKLPKNIKKVFKLQDQYNKTICFELHDNITDEYIGTIWCSTQKENKKTNTKVIVNDFIKMNFPNINIIQNNNISLILNTELDIKDIKIPEGISLNIELYGPYNDIQCSILDENNKKIGIINCMLYEKTNDEKISK